NTATLLTGLPSFLRPLRIGAPLAPRARVELAALQAGNLRRKEVVARRDARAAIVDRLGGCVALQYGFELLLQLRGRLEGSLRREVVAAEAVLRAGDPACRRIDRLPLGAGGRPGASGEEQGVRGLCLGPR